jgi:hypothetical protein
MNTRPVTHKKLVQLHRNIAAWHNDLHGFYRFNWAEINGSFRNDVPTPALLLESYSSQLATNASQTTNFNERAISFLLLDNAANDDYDKQEDVLNDLEGVALDIVSLLDKFRKEESHWLHGLFDVANVEIQKVGPMFGNMYGWNVLYSLKNHESMKFDSDKWTMPVV